ncbi:MAG: hypothetical protein AB4372_37030 [Xenococcus sp. (in: cyanobacteria)]
MKYTEAIAAIQSSELENKGDIIAALNSHSEELTSDRDKHKKTAEDTNKSLEVIMAAAGQVEGELTEKLSNTAKAFNDLTTKNKELTAKVADHEAKDKSLERDRAINRVSAISGANSDVLKTLLSEKDELVINDEKKTVTINGISYEDWAGKDERKVFRSLLIPKKEDLPGGGGNPENNNPPKEKTTTDTVLKNSNW